MAKQVATFDHLTEGRLIFGVGVGGEFPKEYEVCGVPRNERGARLTEGIGLLRRFWSGETVSHDGRFYGNFTDVPMRPPARQSGARQSGAPAARGRLRRTGRLADGWLSYVVTPEMYRAALEKIDAAAREAGRKRAEFGTGHLLFTRIDDSYEKALDAATETLSVRYAMDFRKAAQRYCALGRPDQVAERIREFHAAGVRHVILDLLGPYEQRREQIEMFAAEAMPMLQATSDEDAHSKERCVHMAGDQRRDLTAMLRPSSIALVGATDRSRWSQNTFDNLINRKYSGEVYLVSRRGGTVHGRTAATSCVGGRRADRSRSADGADAGDGGGAGRPRRRRCAQRGNPGFGFAETGYEGADQQARLAALARRHGVSLLGPNCLGFVNFIDNVPLWTGGFRAPSRPGSIAVVTQSGANGSFISSLAQQHEIGLSHMVSTGNEADLDCADFIDHLVGHARSPRGRPVRRSDPQCVKLRRGRATRDRGGQADRRIEDRPVRSHRALRAGTHRRAGGRRQGVRGRLPPTWHRARGIRSRTCCSPPT